MRVARAYQVPHSTFLSWSQADRDKAIWWEVRQGETCRNCGTRPAEWDPEQGGDRRAYVAKLETCRGCQQIEARRAAIPEGHPGLGQHILLVRPHELAEPDEAEEVTGDGPA
jgi:hypothetical protein